ncbi:MAG: restriction endonuclease [Turicibacter sp.]|nr:restriction endonuclease [Turicibacter sp.]
MKDLNENKVERWLSLIMICCFAWVTYFYFQNFFIGIVEAFAALPFWWFLMVLPLFAMSVVWSINLGEYEIKELEKKVRNNQKVMTERERCLRLMHYNIQQIPPIQFVAYCADLLRLLEYGDVKIDRLASNVGKGIRAITPLGNQVYIECQHHMFKQVINEEMIQTLYAAMLENDIKEGLFITASSFTPAAIDWAKAHQIKCVDGQALNELVMFATREGREQLTKEILS